MSDQPQGQSNLQTLGAGFLGFAVVMAIGGGALLFHSAHKAKEAAKPDAAAPPIDLGASAPRPAAPAVTAAEPQVARHEPAPVVTVTVSAAQATQAMNAFASVLKATADAKAAADATAASGTPAPAPALARAAPAGKTAAPRLASAQHLGKPDGSSAATAVVANEPATQQAEKADDKKAATKADPAAAAVAAAVASVHYGVTSRSELMGRAAGPVLNFTGGAAKGGAGASGKMGDDIETRAAELKRQLDAAGLPADQRAKLQKELDDALKGPQTATAAAQ